MARHTDTRVRMLNTAANLFHAQGYHATGLNQVLSAGGLPKGSLYFHFPGGKEQLAAEAIAVSSDRFCEALRAMLTNAPDPAAAIDAVVEHLSRTLVESGFRRGCPVSTVALDAAADSEPIREACADGLGSWQAAIEESLTTGGIDTARARGLATMILASVEGALLLARTQRDPAPLRAVAAHLRTLIETEL